MFQLTPSGTLTTLHSFSSQAACVDGSGPQAPLIQGSDGNFYGTTTSGGGANDGGTVFQLKVSGTPPTGTLTTLYTFCSQTDCSDGRSLPQA